MIENRHEMIENRVKMVPESRSIDTKSQGRRRAVEAPRCRSYLAPALQKGLHRLGESGEILPIAGKSVFEREPRS